MGLLRLTNRTATPLLLICIVRTHATIAMYVLLSIVSRRDRLPLWRFPPRLGEGVLATGVAPITLGVKFLRLGRAGTVETGPV